MHLVQIFLMNIGRQEDVQRLGLVDKLRAITGEINQPTLVKLEGGFEDGFFIIAQEVEMLHRATGGDDIRPNIIRVLPFFAEQLVEMAVTHIKRTRQRFMGKAIARNRLNAGAGATANDGNRGGRCNGGFVRKNAH